MKRKIDGPFHYLVDRILHRRCVPLIGAGISTQSTREGQPWDGHKIWELISRALKPTLAARLKRFAARTNRFRVCARCHECFGNDHAYRAAYRNFGIATLSNCFLCDLRLAKEQNALTKACEAFLWEHGGSTRGAYEALVEQLQIKEFTKLDPRPAHFYLAFLAREGLVTEFITTNYDCNLERAYERTWHGRGSSGTTSMRAVFDLDTFAENAAVSADSRPGEDTAHALRVYKINGCAAELSGNPDHAKDILLTASQLQDWRERKWAADYFRTKVRTASLVTIGFGSDEPQVVHTLQQVLEEFSGLRKRAPRGIYEAENAPIVTTYEHYPTFQQLQLVHGFAAWWTNTPTDGDALVIGPYERAALGPGSDVPLEAPACLPADRLWADVFQAAFSRLLWNKMREAAVSENSAFTAAVPHADRLLLALAAEVDSHASAQFSDPGTSAHWLVQPYPFATAGAPPRPAISRCLSHIRDAGEHPDYYAAVNDHPSLVAELALLFFLLRSGDSFGGSGWSNGSSWWEGVSLLPGGPIEVRLRSNDGEDVPEAALYVSGRRLFEDGKCLTIPGRVGPMQRVELLVGTSGSARRLVDRRAYVVTGTEKTPVVIVRIDWRSLFPASMPEASLPEVSQRLREVVRFPSRFRRRLDPSVRTNPFLQRRVTT